MVTAPFGRRVTKITSGRRGLNISNQFKGTIRGRKSSLSYFILFRIFYFLIFFCIFRENLTILNYLRNNSLGNSIFLEGETFLCWELIFAGEF